MIPTGRLKQCDRDGFCESLGPACVCVHACLLLPFKNIADLFHCILWGSYFIDYVFLGCVHAWVMNSVMLFHMVPRLVYGRDVCKQ